MKSRILLLLCFLLCGIQAFAQISVSGKVVDAGGFELPGVNISVKGQTIGTMTGAMVRLHFLEFREVILCWSFLMLVLRHKR